MIGVASAGEFVQFFYDHWYSIIVLLTAIITGVLWLYKLRPKLEMEFTYEKSRIKTPHRLTMRTPQLHLVNVVVRYFDTSKRELFYTLNDFKNIKQKSKPTIRKLEILRDIRNNQFVGPWRFEKESNIFWFVLHFIDDRWKPLRNEWCYCRRFRFNSGTEYLWEEERKQIRFQVTGLRITPKECKNCIFKKEWDKGKWR